MHKMIISLIALLLLAVAVNAEVLDVASGDDQDQTALRGERGEKGDKGDTGATGAQGPAGKEGRPGRVIYRTPEWRTATEKGGAASKWAKPQVNKSLARGPQNGGLAGRTKGTTVKSREWKRAASRQELAVVAARQADYTDRVAGEKSQAAVGEHNADPAAHGNLRAWLIAVGCLSLLALLVGVSGHFFPRIRFPRSGRYGY